MIQRILLDVDGVLANLRVALAAKLNRPMPYEAGKRYGFQTAPLWGISAAEMWCGCDRTFWAGVPLMPWAHELVNELELRFGQGNICLLTSPIDEDGCVDGKQDWVKEHFPAYRRRTMIGPAKEFCAGSPKHALIDDRPENIDTFAAAGGSVFTFPAPWNDGYLEAANPMPAVHRWLSSLDE